MNSGALPGVSARRELLSRERTATVAFAAGRTLEVVDGAIVCPAS